MSRLEKIERAMELQAMVFRIMFRFESRKDCLFPVTKKIIEARSVRDRKTVVLLESRRRGGRREDFFLEIVLSLFSGEESAF